MCASGYGVGVVEGVSGRSGAASRVCHRWLTKVGATRGRGRMGNARKNVPDVIEHILIVQCHAAHERE